MSERQIDFSIPTNHPHFKSEAFRDGWTAYVEQRQLKPRAKRFVTQSAVNLALKKLGRMGEPDAVEAVENAAIGGWQGIHPPYHNRKGGGNGKPTMWELGQAIEATEKEVLLGFQTFQYERAKLDDPEGYERYKANRLRLKDLERQRGELI